jgi:hypothetical protein
MRALGAAIGLSRCLSSASAERGDAELGVSRRREPAWACEQVGEALARGNETKRKSSKVWVAVTSKRSE